ncbi:hypothetical protein RJT34_08571 [Clitoria ternatea]|uniref:MADS-box domain-containing protein n=1 Tax=Clitoria ternatea TaxID=43366 RepID=A0AAN9PU59_CLITE
MGRVKLQIKKIENTTNRQVTFSKRRNGIIKKAYELSVLCDVHVALIMFSPSGRPTLFSANTSIEEILERYVNLPESERGRLKAEADQLCHVPSTVTSNSQLEVQEIQREIYACKSQLEEMEKRLRVFEGDPSEITTLCEAEYREHVLRETLNQVQLQKVHVANTVDVNGFVTRTSKNPVDWFPHGDPLAQILNFTNAYDIAPLRYFILALVNIPFVRPYYKFASDCLPFLSALRDLQSHNMIVDMLSPTSTVLHSSNMDQDCQMSLRNGLEVGINNTIRPQFGQVIQTNSSSWQYHPIGMKMYSFPASSIGYI